MAHLFTGASCFLMQHHKLQVTGIKKKSSSKVRLQFFSSFPAYHIHTSSSLPLLLSKACFVVFLSWLSCLGQSVTLSSMMEDLGISLQCYKGSKRRSRPHSGAKSACVFCQPKRSSKREVARRDSSTWATLIRNKRRKETELGSEFDCCLKVFHVADWF